MHRRERFFLQFLEHRFDLLVLLEEFQKLANLTAHALVGMLGKLEQKRNDVCLFVLVNQNQRAMKLVQVIAVNLGQFKNTLTHLGVAGLEQEQHDLHVALDVALLVQKLQKMARGRLALNVEKFHELPAFFRGNSQSFRLKQIIKLSESSFPLRMLHKNLLPLGLSELTIFENVKELEGI